jgi:hypothetical protein
MPAKASLASVRPAEEYLYMPTESDMRMAKLKAAIDRCRQGDASELLGIEISPADLLTIGALAKATGDTFTYRLTQRLLGHKDRP